MDFFVSTVFIDNYLNKTEHRTGQTIVHGLNIFITLLCTVFTISKLI